MKELERGDVRLLYSCSDYSRCSLSLPRLIVEESYEKAENETDVEVVAGELKVIVEEKDPVTSRSN